MSTKLMRSGPARLFNSLMLRFAGRRFFPLYGVIEHRGRRSGRIFHTPVVVRPLADGFVVPMPWGERTDWYRNVRAAGNLLDRLTAGEVTDYVHFSFWYIFNAADAAIVLGVGLLLLSALRGPEKY